MSHESEDIIETIITDLGKTLEKTYGYVVQIVETTNTGIVPVGVPIIMLGDGINYIALMDSHFYIWKRKSHKWEPGPDLGDVGHTQKIIGELDALPSPSFASRWNGGIQSGNV